MSVEACGTVASDFLVLLRSNVLGTEGFVRLCGCGGGHLCSFHDLCPYSIVYVVSCLIEDSSLSSTIYLAPTLGHNRRCLLSYQLSR